MAFVNSQIPGWRYYDHAAIPSIAPHKQPDLTPIKEGSIWHIEGKHPILARYTTEWDCGYDTGWWYIIKDTKFDITTLKKKRRYEITKSLRFFEVKEIYPLEYASALANVNILAYSAYPKKYRPNFNEASFIKTLEKWNNRVKDGSVKVFGAFYRETGKLCGYNYISIMDDYCSLAIQKTIPDFEKYNVNAGLIFAVLKSLQDKLSKGYYICDGARNINHETCFQDYLEKYFEFRKCFCKLKIQYSLSSQIMMNFLFPFRRLIALLGRYIGFFHLVSGVLKMDEIARKS